MKLLFMDTETSGLPDVSKYPDHPSQPRVLQIAALQTDENGKELNSLICLLQPDDIPIDPRAEAVHKLSTELLAERGLNRTLAVKLWHNLVVSSDLVIGHNIPFDWFMSRIEFIQNELPYFEKPQFCTMRETTDICKIPGKWGKYKWPKLREASDKLFPGRLMPNLHDAGFDLSLCRDLYFHLQVLKEGVS